MNRWKQLAEVARRRRVWLAGYIDFSAGVPDVEVLHSVPSTLASAAFEPLVRV